MSAIDIRDQARNANGITAALVFYSSLGIVVFLIFCSIRTKFPSIFAPKSRLSISSPPDLSSGFFSWIPQVVQIRERDILERNGLDAVVLLRFLRMCLVLFAIISVFAVTILIPVNVANFDATNKVNTNITSELRALRSMSIEGIAAESSALRTHFVMTWLFSVLTMVFLGAFFKRWVALRLHFARRLLKINEKRLDTRSIMVNGVPRELMDEGKLATYFQKLGLGRVENVVVCRKWVRLRAALGRRALYLEKIEHVCTRILGNPPKISALISASRGDEEERQLLAPSPGLVSASALGQSPEPVKKTDSVIKTDSYPIPTPTPAPTSNVQGEIRTENPTTNLANPDSPPIDDQQEFSPTPIITTSIAGMKDVHDVDGETRIVPDSAAPTHLDSLNADQNGEIPPPQNLTSVYPSISTSARFDAEKVGPSQSLQTHYNPTLAFHQSDDDAPPSPKPTTVFPSTVTPTPIDREGIFDIEKEIKRILGSNPRPKMKTGFLGLLGPEVDELQFYTEKFKKWDKRTIECRVSPYASQPTSLAFVTFDSPRAAVYAAQSVVSSQAYTLMTSMAPEPRDVYWKNISSRVAHPYLKSIRSVLVFVALLVIIALWFIPVTALASLFALENLIQTFPELKPVFENMNFWLSSAIQTILPTLVLSIWLGLLPGLLHFLSIFQGLERYSAIEKSVLSKYYFYQMFNVLFVFTIAGAVLKSLNAIIREPGQVIESLGRNLPGVAPFFVNYVNLQGLFLTPLEFLRVGPLLLRLITRWWPWTITPRQYAATCEHEDIGIHYGIVYVFPLLVGTIGLTYSTIQPLIAPFTALYFAIALFVFKYLICYVHIPRYETGGSFASMLVKRFVIGLIFYQITMAGVLAFKGAPILGIPGIAPLVGATIMFYWWLSKGYDPLGDVWPISVVSEVLDEINDEIQVGRKQNKTSGLRKRFRKSMGKSTDVIRTDKDPADAIPESIDEHTVDIGADMVAGLDAGADVDAAGDQDEEDTNDFGPTNPEEKAIKQAPKGIVTADVEGKAFSSVEEARANTQKLGWFKQHWPRLCAWFHSPQRMNPYPVWPKNQKWECDRKTDYREPGMTRLYGVLDPSVDCTYGYLHEKPLVGIDLIDDFQMRSYLHPALVARLPELWVPGGPDYEYKRIADLQHQRSTWLDEFSIDGIAHYRKTFLIASSSSEPGDLLNPSEDDTSSSASEVNLSPVGATNKKVLPKASWFKHTYAGAMTRGSKILDDLSGWLLAIGT